MKTLKFTLLLAFTMFTTYSFTQTGQWKLAGNQLTGTEKLGSTNSAALNFITNNKTRMSLTGAGDLKFSSDQSAIQFPNPGASPKPMMLMFATGTENPNRMVIAHSPAFTNFGLQYNDAADRFDFLSAGTSIFNVNLGSSSVGVNANFNVAGTSTFTGSVNIGKLNSNGGNLGIGTLNPASTLHVFKGSAGIVPFFDAPLVVENSSNSYLNLLAPNNFETGVLFGNNSSNVDGGIIYNNSFNFRSIQFRTNGNITRMVLLSNGFLGVRTVLPAVEMHLLHEDGEDSHHGLRIQNVGSKNASWTLYASNQDEALSLFAKNNLVGFFNISGEYNELSDARRKKDIEPAQGVLQKVMQLNVKKYHFLENKPADKKHYGMIAQDVEKIFPEVVSHKVMDSSHSDLYAMNYGAFGVIAIKAIQEQQATIDSQKNDIKELKKLVDKLEQQITAITSSPSVQNASSATQTKIILSSAYLKQNTPNPFNGATSISYYVPENKNAFVEITTANGQLIKTFPLTQKGNGQLFIEAGTLKTGIYYYTLKVDGVKVDTKQMILAK